MRLLSVNKAPSPDRPGFTRLTGQIQLGAEKSPRVYWLEVPDAFAADLVEDGNPWLVLMNCLGSITGEDIACDLPVDEKLALNLRGVRRQFNVWDRRYHHFEAHTPHQVLNQPAGSRTGLFFSAGIDSFYSLLMNRAKPHMSLAAKPITDVMHVWGADIPHTNAALLQKIAAVVKNYTEANSLTYIPVITNLRTPETQVIGTGGEITAEWVPLAHGAALGFIAQALRARFREVVIAASYNYGRLVSPNGSSPLTDHLFSSSTLKITPDDHNHDRIERIAAIAHDPAIMRSLSICPQYDRTPEADPAILNCSACDKCLRNMVFIDALNARGKATSFDWTHYSHSAVARLFVPEDEARIVLTHACAIARRNGKDDLAQAIEGALRHSRRWRWLGRLEGAVLAACPWLWRYRKSLRGWRNRAYALCGFSRG